MCNNREGGEIVEDLTVLTLVEIEGNISKEIVDYTLFINREIIENLNIMTEDNVCNKGTQNYILKEVLKWDIKKNKVF